MSYALLWIETLIVALLWMATLTACAAHIRSKWPRRLLAVAGFLPPFLLLGGMTALAAFMKFFIGYFSSWFGYMASLLGGFIIGAAAIRYRAISKSNAAPIVAGLTWPRGRLAAALVTASVLAVMTLWNMDLEARNRAAALRIQAGTLLLAVAPPPVPDNLNAAIPYVKAFTRLDKEVTLAAGKSPLDDETLDIHDASTLAALERNQPTLALLHQAATLPDCRFDHDYARPSITMLLPELNRARTAARLLRLHARRELSLGHVPAAITDVNTIFHLGRDIGREPFMIGGLVGVAVDAMAVDLLQEVLPAVTRKEDLDALQPGDSESIGRMFRRSLQGEEAFGLSMFSDFFSGDFDLPQMQQIVEGRQVPTVAWNAPFGILVRVFLFSDDISAYRHLMAEYQQAALMPYSKGRDKAAEAEKLLQPPNRAPLTSLIGPALSNAFRVTARTQAQHDSAMVAIAMTRYRLDHGGLPDKIETLVPTYLEEVPADPFDGNPLRVTSKNGDVIIYSVGPDLHDDGGAPYVSKTKTGDFGFHMNPKPATPDTMPAR